METLQKVQKFLLAAIVLLAGSWLAVTALAGTKIYRTVDEDGNVVFTDVPPRAEQPAKPVDLQAPNSFTPEAGATQIESPDGRELWIVDPEADTEAEAPAASYNSLVIASPANDASLRENSGNVAVVAELEPELAPSHELRLLLDGNPAATAGEDGRFALANVDRGTHTLQAQVINRADGTVVFSGEQSVFHLQRYSQLTAPNRRPPPNRPGGN